MLVHDRVLVTIHLGALRACPCACRKLQKMSDSNTEDVAQRVEPKTDSGTEGHIYQCRCEERMRMRNGNVQKMQRSKYARRKERVPRGYEEV